MSDATIVIETDHKGGSMITANLAFHYDRSLFAVPGRTTDPKSNGCNKLILQNKASIYTDMNEFLEWMGWDWSDNTPTSTDSKSKKENDPEHEQENENEIEKENGKVNEKENEKENEKKNGKVNEKENGTQSQNKMPPKNHPISIVDLSPEESTIATMLRESESKSIDEIYLNSGLSNSAVATALLNLEMKKCLEILPGKRYKIKI